MCWQGGDGVLGLGLDLGAGDRLLPRRHGKVVDGAQFFGRGLRLLGSDVSNAGKLFSQAALGECCRPALSSLSCHVLQAGTALLLEEDSQI